MGLGCLPAPKCCDYSTHRYDILPSCKISRLFLIVRNVLPYTEQLHVLSCYSIMDRFVSKSIINLERPVI